MFFIRIKIVHGNVIIKMGFWYIYVELSLLFKLDDY